MIELAKEIKKIEKLNEDIGLSEEEMAFYDAISAGRKAERIFSAGGGASTWAVGGFSYYVLP